MPSSAVAFGALQEIVYTEYVTNDPFMCQAFAMRQDVVPPAGLTVSRTTMDA